MKSALLLTTCKRSLDMSQTWGMNSTSRKLLKLAGLLAVVVASCAGYSA